MRAWRESNWLTNAYSDSSQVLINKPWHYTKCIGFFEYVNDQDIKEDYAKLALFIVSEIKRCIVDIFAIYDKTETLFQNFT